MRNTSRDRNLAAGNPPEKVIVTHSWLPYSCLSLLYAGTALGWFCTMIATVGKSSNDANTTGTVANPIFSSGLMAAFFAFINLYLFRMITLFVSLAITYHAERHYLSRGAAWTSWTLNLLLLFSWLATDLPFVYSAFSDYSGGNPVNGATGATPNAVNTSPNGLTQDSMRTHFCNLSNYWCNLNLAQGAFSVIAGFLLLLTWMFSCYQLKRARGVSNLLLTWPETLVINLIALGIVGYLIWTLSSITLGFTRMFDVFGYLDSQGELNTWRMSWSSLVWGNYLIHGAWFASMGTAAYICFGGTTAPRMSAMIANWLSFMCLFPATIYLDRNQNDFGQCDGSYGNGSLRCPSLNGVAAGMSICTVINFLLGLAMFAVLMQAETADFAVDMYGDKARAIDDARSTGTLPMKDIGANNGLNNQAGASYDTTRPSTPEQAYRANAPLTGNNMTSSTGPYTNQNQPIVGGPLNRGEDVELGAPVY